VPEVLRHCDYALLARVTGAMTFASQMIAVAIGWQVYAIHRKAFDLGLIGLAEFAPLVALPDGQIADRLSRQAVLATALQWPPQRAISSVG
jgi:hypothetical protein